MAIRDGKISSEIVRRVDRPVTPERNPFQRPDPAEAAPVEEKESITYHEYVVLDSAGRLQIPREWLEKLQIGKRAQLDLQENTIHINPVVDQSNPAATNKPLTLEEQLALIYSEEPPLPRKSVFTRLTSRFRR